MKKKLIAGMITGLFTIGIVGSVNAASFTFDGNIVYHNDIVEIAFSLDEDASDVSVWTDSFLSGTNFDPITALWEFNGSDYNLIAENDDNATIAAGQTWYDSGFSLDFLEAGAYLFTIATYSNFASGTLLSDGFNYDNQTPVLLSEWDQPANDVGMGTYYRVNLDGVDAASNNTDPAPTPEPVTMLLFSAGLAGLGGSRLRRNKA